MKWKEAMESTGFEYLHCDGAGWVNEYGSSFRRQRSLCGQAKTDTTDWARDTVFGLVVMRYVAILQGGGQYVITYSNVERTSTAVRRGI